MRARKNRPVAFLASILGFGVTIVAAILIYAFAFDGTVWLIEQIAGPRGPTEKLVIVFALIFVFISIATRVGRHARDWIEAGRKVQRQPAR